MKCRLLFCFLVIFLMCGCSNETDGGYRSLSDLMTTERSTENDTEAETVTEDESTEETSANEEDTSGADTDTAKTYVDVVPSRPQSADEEDTSSAEDDSDSENTTDSAVPAKEPEKIIIYQYVEVPVLPNDYFFSEDFSHRDNTLVFSPREIFYSNGKLYATMYVYNGHDTTATDIRDIYLSFDNGTTAIAAANFDFLSGCSIAPDCYVLWEFIFPAEAVFLNNTNLHNINTTYKSTYTY